jgi:hypothetical protein
VIRRWGGLLKIFTTDGTDLQMGEKGRLCVVMGAVDL